MNRIIILCMLRRYTGSLGSSIIPMQSDALSSYTKGIYWKGRELNAAVKGVIEYGSKDNVKLEKDLWWVQGCRGRNLDLRCRQQSLINVG